MKRKLGVIIRVLLAVAGLGLIIGLVAYYWQGQAVIPADYQGDGGPARRVTIVSVDRSSGEPVYHFRPKQQMPPLPASAFGSGDDTPTLIPGIPQMIRAADPWLAAVALVLAGLSFPLQALRWLMLMRCRGMTVGYGKALKLTMVGQFFSVCLPGSTGGDLMKAYYAAKGSGANTKAVMSVVADRVLGLIGLVILVGVVGLLGFGRPVIRGITIGAWVALFGLLVAGVLYASPTLRGLLKVGALVERLPGRQMIRAIDEAAVAYRNHLDVVGGGILLSVLAHLCLASSAACIGLSLGIDLPYTRLIALLPVVLLCAAVPIMPSGLGLMEGAAVLLIDAPTGMVIGMMLGYRLVILVYAMVGGGAVIRGDIHLHPQSEARG